MPMWTRLRAINREYQTFGLRVAKKLLAEAGPQLIDRKSWKISFQLGS